MSAVNDGGLAFPKAGHYSDSGPARCDSDNADGMSLRAYIAVKSLGIAYDMESRSPTYSCDGCPTYRGTAERAVLMADALIKALEVPNV